MDTAPEAGDGASAPGEAAAAWRPASRAVHRARLFLFPRARAAPRVRGVRVGGEARPVRVLEWRGRLGTRRRAALVAELVGFFFLLPLSLVLLNQSGLEVPPMPALLVVTLVSWAVLLFDPAFPRREWAGWNAPRREVVRVLAQFAAGALFLFLLTAWLAPDDLFLLPRERPGLWLAVLVFYPLLSVYPQELVWRVFFVHRYRRLLRSSVLTVVLSAATFGFVHLLYGSWISVGLSTLGGLLFGATYLRTRSVLLASLEHTLYGCFIFTVGLHEYFYSGV